MKLNETDQQAIEKLAEEYRLEDNRLLWANRRRSNPPSPADILTGFLNAGGSADVTLTQITEALTERLNVLRATVTVTRRQLYPSSYDLDILKRGFRWSEVGEDVAHIYVIRNSATRTVTTIPDRKNIRETLYIHGLIDDHEAHYNKVIDRAIANGEVDKIFGSIIRDNEVIVPAYEDYIDGVAEFIPKLKSLRIPEPKRLSNNPKVPNFTYFDLDSIEEGDCSDWTDWELSMPEYCRPVWRAWFYSIFVAKNEGRQLCWLHGEGYDGKSAVGKAIRRILGQGATASINKMALGNQFGFSGLYGKRFVLYGDCRNPLVSHSEKIHQITGGDIVSVEFKNQTAFAGRIYGKLLINANTGPSINYHERNERSRIIYIPLGDPPDRVRRKFYLTDDKGKFIRRNGNEVGVGYPLEDRMVEQASAYLALCRPYYKELCPKDSELVLPEKMVVKIEDSCASEDSIDYAKFVEEELVVDPDGWVDSRELRLLFGEFLGASASQYDYSGLLRYLQSKYKSERTRRREGSGSRVYVVTGVRLKTNAFSVPEVEDDTEV